MISKRRRNTYFLFLGDVCQEGLHRKSGIENAGKGEEKYCLMDLCFRYHIWTNERKLASRLSVSTFQLLF